MSTRSRCIAVFGSSEPREGDPAYAEAYSLGEQLAAAGFATLTGGYGGVMEAASRGAHERGGHVVGVISDIFSHRDPNPYLLETVPSRDLHERTQKLIDRADGFTVLPGKAGTLSELTFLWALDRIDALRRPLVLVGPFWSAILRQCREQGVLSERTADATRLADGPAEAVAILSDGFAGRDVP